jgi:hypothetical protein
MIEQVFWISSLAALGLAVYQAGRRRRFYPLFWTLLVLVVLLTVLVAGGVVALPWAEPLKARGEEETEWALIASLYAVMVLGMLAHYGYERFQRPLRRRTRFDGGALLAPIFVSPIVFLPLASILESTTSVQAIAPRLMLFLVAFENGFFWREFFDNRSRTREAGREE